MGEVSVEDNDILGRFRLARERAERVARHYGFAFYIANGFYSEYAGWKSENREATEVEQELWAALDRLAPADL